MTAAEQPGGKAASLAGRELEQRVDELHEVEFEGESPATPFIATAGVWLFILPLFLFMLGAALAAYYLG
jgi:hypothetical protein